MRILYLADTYRPARTACANRSAVLVEALRAAGYEVNILASSDSLVGSSKSCDAFADVAYFETFPLVKKTLVNRLRNNFGGAREAIKVAAGMGAFDIVVCTTPPLMLTTSAVNIAKRKHAKLVLDVRDIWPDVAYEMGSFSSGSIYGRFFERVARRAYQAADLVVTVSPGKVAKLKERVPSGRVALVPNGIDRLFLETDEDFELVKRLRLDEGLICAYVGNIGLAQGLSTLLDIAKVRPNVRFLLFGEGADRAKLETRAKTGLIENVEFCGTVDARGAYTVLRHAAMSYVPLVSSQLRDSIPTKMYEALACGCPVLLAAEGDAVDLLDACGLGAHAAPEDSAALLGAFDWLMSHSFSDEDRTSASRWILENHSRQKFACYLVNEVSALEGCRV